MATWAVYERIYGRLWMLAMRRRIVTTMGALFLLGIGIGFGSGWYAMKSTLPDPPKNLRIIARP